MQSLISDSEPFDEVLMREGDLTVTSTRLEHKNETYALKYISTVILDKSHQPQGEAIFAIVVSVVATLVALVYAGMGKVSIAELLLYLCASLCALAVGVLVYWMNTTKYTLNVNLVSGELVRLESRSETYIHSAHKALSTALALNRPPVERVMMEAAPLSSHQASASLQQRFHRL